MSKVLNSISHLPQRSHEILRMRTVGHSTRAFAVLQRGWFSNEFFLRQSTPSGRDLRGKFVLFKGELHLSMMTEENSMDGLLKEAQHSKSASAKPSKTLGNLRTTTTTLVNNDRKWVTGYCTSATSKFRRRRGVVDDAKQSRITSSCNPQASAGINPLF